MSNDDIGPVIEAIVILSALIAALYFLFNGMAQFGAADYFKDPIHAFESQLSGLVQIAVSSTILLVLTGAGALVVSALLEFLSKVREGF
jgi:hypothetical protein